MFSLSVFQSCWWERLTALTLLSLPPTEKSRGEMCVSVCVCVCGVCVCVWCVCVRMLLEACVGCFLRCLASILFPLHLNTDSTESLTTWVFEKHFLEWHWWQINHLNVQKRRSNHFPELQQLEVSLPSLKCTLVVEQCLSCYFESVVYQALLII